MVAEVSQGWYLSYALGHEGWVALGPGAPGFKVKVQYLPSV